MFFKLNVELIRLEDKNDCIIGVLCIENEIFCVTLELSYKNNEPFVSSIPAGKYKCKLRSSSKYERVYEVLDVPGRYDILIHLGNTVSDIAGCILLGERFGYLGGERAVLNSIHTFNKFMDKMKDYREFGLTIINFCDRGIEL